MVSHLPMLFSVFLSPLFIPPLGPGLAAPVLPHLPRSSICRFWLDFSESDFLTILCSVFLFLVFDPVFEIFMNCSAVLLVVVGLDWCVLLVFCFCLFCLVGSCWFLLWLVQNRNLKMGSGKISGWCFWGFLWWERKLIEVRPILEVPFRNPLEKSGRGKFGSGLCGVFVGGQENDEKLADLGVSFRNRNCKLGRGNFWELFVWRFYVVKWG